MQSGEAIWLSVSSAVVTGPQTMGGVDIAQKGFRQSHSGVFVEMLLNGYSDHKRNAESAIREQNGTHRCAQLAPATGTGNEQNKLGIRHVAESMAVNTGRA
jgi:hypothetical protein